ncbi:MAG: four-carbon acid sugar kinase family protein [Thermodesulfobacteriota bacterium]
MEPIVVLADDLTGAADTGIQFLRVEKPAYMIRGSRLEDVQFATPPDVLSVYTQTRGLSGEHAAIVVAKAAATLSKIKPGLVYKKLDSCFRGNVGEELDAMLSTLQVQACFIAPAFPEQGRTTIHGVHYLHGVPVSETEMGHDPVSPVKDSRLVFLLSTKSRYQVGQIDVDDYAHGREFVKNKVQIQLEKGCRHIVFDAVEQSHLDMVAELGNLFFTDTLFAGSAGLAASVTRSLKNGTGLSGAHQLPVTGNTNMLFVCGSASEKTTQQVKRLLAESNRPNIVLKAGLLANTLDEHLPQQLTLNASRLFKKHSLVIQLSPRPEQGFDFNPDMVLQGLARITQELLRMQKPACLFLSGGDTADGVLQKTKVKYVQLKSELMPGVVQGCCCGGLLDQVPVATKAGSFGNSDILLQVLQKMSSTGMDIQ